MPKSVYCLIYIYDEQHARIERFLAESELVVAEHILKGCLSFLRNKDCDSTYYNLVIDALGYTYANIQGGTIGEFGAEFPMVKEWEEAILKGMISPQMVLDALHRCVDLQEEKDIEVIEI